MPADITPEALAEIEARDKEAPGRVDCSGKCPRVYHGYEARFIHLLRDGPIYARRKAGREANDAEIAAHVRPLFEPAYQAHRDVRALCASLRAAWAERDALRRQVEAHKGECGCLCFCRSCEEERARGQ